MSGDFYDASQPARDLAAEAPDLTRMAEDAHERELLDFLDELDEQLDLLEAADAAQGVDPLVIETLVAVCSAEDAPMELRSYKARVDAGFTTWEEVFRHLPEEGQAGWVLLGSALNRAVAEMPDIEELTSEALAAVERGEAGTADGSAGGRDDSAPPRPTR